MNALLKVATGVILPVTLLVACATSPRTFYTFNEIVVVNLSRELLRDVTIRDVINDRRFGCGNIAPRGICANEFAPRPYRQNPIRISWTFGDYLRQSEDFVVEVPAGADPERPLRGVLEVSPRGAIRAYFEPGKPVY